MNARICTMLLSACVVPGALGSQAPNSGMAHMHSGAVMYHAPQWSPDAKWLLVTSNRGGQSEIYLVRPDGSALRQVTHGAGTEIARWSGDGKRIQFVRHESGAMTEVSVDLDGKSVRPELRDSVLSRSPDGAQLIFESVRGGLGRLFLMSASRTSVREIATLGAHAEQGSFSPDGRSIVSEQRATMHNDIPASKIVVSRPDGSEAKVVAAGTDPSWSRDGQLILFKSWDDATKQLWISTVSPSGAGFRRLAPGMHPSWSPDGTQIAYMRDRNDGGADIWVMNRDGGGGRCVTCVAPFR